MNGLVVSEMESQSPMIWGCSRCGTLTHPSHERRRQHDAIGANKLSKRAVTEAEVRQIAALSELAVQAGGSAAVLASIT
jgi:hypothetical protein